MDHRGCLAGFHGAWPDVICSWRDGVARGGLVRAACEEAVAMKDAGLLRQWHWALERCTPAIKQLLPDDEEKRKQVQESILTRLRLPAAQGIFCWEGQLEAARALVAGASVALSAAAIAKPGPDKLLDLQRGIEEALDLPVSTDPGPFRLALEARNIGANQSTRSGNPALAITDLVMARLGESHPHDRQILCWVWDTARDLLKEPRSHRRCRVAVAWAAQEGTGGGLHTLELDVVTPGLGVAVQAIDSIFRTYVDEGCRCHLNYAWQAALASRPTLGEGESRELPDGRWRLYQGSHVKAKHDTLVGDIGGSSGSGAAALGWAMTLRGRRPDPGVVVIGQINEKLEFTGLDGEAWENKVRGILRDEPLIDTIVVDPSNKVAVEQALANAGALGRVRANTVG